MKDQSCEKLDFRIRRIFAILIDANGRRINSPIYGICTVKYPVTTSYVWCFFSCLWTSISECANYARFAQTLFACGLLIWDSVRSDFRKKAKIPQNCGERCMSFISLLLFYFYKAFHESGIRNAKQLRLHFHRKVK